MRSCKVLQREDLFFVTAEHFVTDTAAYADIVLPATMAGEHDDMMFSWGHFYLTFNEKAIEPAARRSPMPRSSACWRRLGFDDPQFKMGDMELAEHYVKWDAPQMAGVDMEYFRKHGYFHLAVGTPDDRLPHAEGSSRRRQARSSSWLRTPRTSSRRRSA